MGSQLEALLDLIYELEAEAADPDFLANGYFVVPVITLNALVASAENADPRLEEE